MPLDSLKLSGAEQDILIAPEKTRAQLLINLGLMQIDLQRKVAWTEQAVEKLQKEQAMKGEAILHEHGKDPSLAWVYNSERGVIERSS